MLRGDDPIEVRLAKRDRARALSADRILFKDAAKEFLAVHAPTWRNVKHRKQWLTTLESYAFPTLGHRPIAAIDGALITEALAPIWLKRMETASRVKQRIQRVIQWVKNGKPLPQLVVLLQKMRSPR